MKRLVLIILISSIFCGCSKDNDPSGELYFYVTGNEGREYKGYMQYQHQGGASLPTWGETFNKDFTIQEIPQDIKGLHVQKDDVFYDNSLIPGIWKVFLFIEKEDGTYKIFHIGNIMVLENQTTWINISDL